MPSLALSVLLAAAAQAQDASGFVELRAHGYLGVDGQQVQVVERLRPELEAELSERVLLATTVEAGFSQGRRLQSEVQRTLEESDFGPFLELAQCSWPEEENAFLGISGVEDYLTVDRLYLDVYLPKADLRFGRQAVNWGSALLVNPTDPFPEVLLVEPWRPRRGVNAARVTVPIGERVRTQAVVGSNDAFTAVRAAGRATVNAAGTDFSLVGAWRQEAGDGILGLDVRGTLGVGFWLEGAVHVREQPYEEIAVGVDYSFPVLDRLLVSGQYYRSGGGGDAAASGLVAGSIEPPDCEGDVESPLDAPATDDPFAPFLRGRDYGMVLVALGITPEIRFSALALQNLGDGTGLAVPTLSVHPTGGTEIALAAQLPWRLWGSGGEFRPAEEDLVLTVEPVPGVPVSADLSGLVPEATLILWTRAYF